MKTFTGILNRGIAVTFLVVCLGGLGWAAPVGVSSNAPPQPEMTGAEAQQWAAEFWGNALQGAYQQGGSNTNTADAADRQALRQAEAAADGLRDLAEQMAGIQRDFQGLAKMFDSSDPAMAAHFRDQMRHFRKVKNEFRLRERALRKQVEDGRKRRTSEPRRTTRRERGSYMQTTPDDQSAHLLIPGGNLVVEGGAAGIEAGGCGH